MVKYAEASVPQLTTLEQPVVEAPPYTRYWTEIYHPAVQQMLGHDRLPKSQFVLAEQFLGQVSERVLRQGEPRSLGYFPDILYGEEPRIGSIIAAWDERLGNFNPMADGQGDLVRAAGILLQPNQLGDAPAILKDVGDEQNLPVFSGEVLDALLERTNLRQQRSAGPRLLLAAELLHKAAWVEPDVPRQAYLMDVASRLYGKVGAEQHDWFKGRQRAQAYLADIRHHQAAVQFRQANTLGKSEQEHEQQKAKALETMRQLICRDARAIQKLCEHYSGMSGEKGPLKGYIFERFVPLLLRDTVMADIDDGARTVEFEVRHSFSSEDMGPYRLNPNPQFDIVVQRYAASGEIITTPAQLKIGREPSKREASRYLGNIAFVRVSNLAPEDMHHAAGLLIQQYQDNAAAPWHHSKYLELQDRLQQELLAA